MTTKIKASVVDYVTAMTAGTISLTDSLSNTPNTGTLQFGRPGSTGVKITAGEGNGFKFEGGGVGIDYSIAGLLKLALTNTSTDSSAKAELASTSDRTTVKVGAYSRNQSNPDSSYIDSVAGLAGQGLYIVERGDNSNWIKLGVGSAAYGSPAVTIKKASTAATDKYTGTAIVTGDMGVSGDIWTTVMHGTATAAQYQDVAEKYVPDAEYAPGTVVSFGGAKEITMTIDVMDSAVAGVISTDPAYMMGSEIPGGIYVALLGRVPCKVIGPIKKGDLMVSSGVHGVATAWTNLNDTLTPGSVIGKALENYDDPNSVGVIEVVVGRV